MKAILSRLRSVGRACRGTAGQRASPRAETSTDEQSRVGLFHCPTCDVVYIATEKRVCSECGTDVEQVRSTLQHA